MNITVQEDISTLDDDVILEIEYIDGEPLETLIEEIRFFLNDT